MTYDVSGHWLLSDAAAALSPEALAARAAAAEAALGLPATLTGDDAEVAKQAVAYWINCQLADVGGIKSRSSSKGGQSESVTYGSTRGEKLGHLSDPCAIAHRLASRLVGHAGYESLTALR